MSILLEGNFLLLTGFITPCSINFLVHCFWLKLETLWYLECRTRVTLKRDGILLDLVPPPTKVNNLIFGRTWVDSAGEMILTNMTTGDKVVLYFQPCGWFGYDTFHFYSSFLFSAFHHYTGSHFCLWLARHFMDWLLLHMMCNCYEMYLIIRFFSVLDCLVRELDGRELGYLFYWDHFSDATISNCRFVCTFNLILVLVFCFIFLEWFLRHCQRNRHCWTCG